MSRNLDMAFVNLEQYQEWVYCSDVVTHACYSRRSRSKHEFKVSPRNSSFSVSKMKNKKIAGFQETDLEPGAVFMV